MEGTPGFRLMSEANVGPPAVLLRPAVEEVVVEPGDFLARFAPLFPPPPVVADAPPVALVGAFLFFFVVVAVVTVVVDDVTAAGADEDLDSTGVGFLTVSIWAEEEGVSTGAALIDDDPPPAFVEGSAGGLLFAFVEFVSFF